MDYTWKQNRLSKDKESLKAQMLGVIRKKPTKEDTPGQAGTAQPSNVPNTGATNTASKN